MLIAGVDEVGRGPLAGPVVAATVILPKKYKNPEIKDSKQLSPNIRENLDRVIKNDALSWAIVAVGHTRITRINIREASRLAMSLSLQRAARKVTPELVLVDGNVPIATHFEQKLIIGGDALYVQISAASIIAKVYRDALMQTLSTKYPGYGFERHAGYPTKDHRSAIAALGPCRVHRSSFRGVSEYRRPNTDKNTNLDADIVAHAEQANGSTGGDYSSALSQTSEVLYLENELEMSSRRD